MNSLQEIAKFLNQSPSLGEMAKLVFPPNTPVTMSKLIQILESLPVIELDSQLSPTGGVVPFTVKLSHTVTKGHILYSFEWQVIREGQILAKFDTDRNFQITVDGIHTFRAIFRGVDKTGFKTLSRDLLVTANKPQQASSSSGGSGSGGGPTGGTLPEQIFFFCVTASGSGAMPQEIPVKATSPVEAEAKLIKENLNGNKAGFKIVFGKCPKKNSDEEM